jgi:hypothetical protein
MDTPALFAHINDSIRKLSPGAPAGETGEFFCECPDVGCHEMVALTLLEFDHLRAASPPRPILAIDHTAEPAAVPRA